MKKGKFNCTVEMAGVLFVVCIPREKYEKCISNKQQSSDEDGFYEAKAKIYGSFSSLSIQVVLVLLKIILKN